jgi:Cu/Ag efflux pump CusA
LIVAGTIPVALFLAVIITVLRGESANLLSVGAIDLGIIVDSSVIMLENIFRHLAHRGPRPWPRHRIVSLKNFPCPRATGWNGRASSAHW